MGNIKTVLFVCTGNTCRSVMAEGLLRKGLDLIGRRDIKVISAGVGTIDGMGPAKNTVEIMKKEEIDVSGHKTQGLTNEMIKEADLILVMEEIQRDEVIGRDAEASSKTFLLKKFNRDSKNTETSDRDEIADPMGLTMKVYGRCLAEIKEEIERIVKFL